MKINTHKALTFNLIYAILFQSRKILDITYMRIESMKNAELTPDALTALQAIKVSVLVMYETLCTLGRNTFVTMFLLGERLDAAFTLSQGGKRYVQFVLDCGLDEGSARNFRNVIYGEFKDITNVENVAAFAATLDIDSYTNALEIVRIAKKTSGKVEDVAKGLQGKSLPFLRSFKNEIDKDASVKAAVYSGDYESAIKTVTETVSTQAAKRDKAETPSVPAESSTGLPSEVDNLKSMLKQAENKVDFYRSIIRQLIGSQTFDLGQIEVLTEKQAGKAIMEKIVRRAKSTKVQKVAAK